MPRIVMLLFCVCGVTLLASCASDETDVANDDSEANSDDVGTDETHDDTDATDDDGTDSDDNATTANNPDDDATDDDSASTEPVEREKRIAIGEMAPDFQLKDQTGEVRTLADLLEDGPVALVFYRSADW